MYVCIYIYTCVYIYVYVYIYIYTRKHVHVNVEIGAHGNEIDWLSRPLKKLPNLNGYVYIYTHRGRHRYRYLSSMFEIIIRSILHACF